MLSLALLFLAVALVVVAAFGYAAVQFAREARDDG